MRTEFCGILLLSMGVVNFVLGQEKMKAFPPAGDGMGWCDLSWSFLSRRTNRRSRSSCLSVRRGNSTGRTDIFLPAH